MGKLVATRAGAERTEVISILLRGALTASIWTHPREPFSAALSGRSAATGNVRQLHYPPRWVLIPALVWGTFPVGLRRDRQLLERRPAVPDQGNCFDRTRSPPAANAAARFAHVAETSEQARQDVKFGLEDFTRYFSEVATFPIIPPDVTSDPAEYLVSSGLACIGTPSDCIRHFERLWKGSNGGFGGILLLAHNWADWPATKRSYELMARYVHPHFQRNSNELRDWSYDDAKSKYTTAGLQSKAAVQAAIDTYQRRKG